MSSYKPGRARSMHSLLKQFGEIPIDEQYWDVGRNRRRELGNRTVHLDEMQKICEELGLPSDGKKTELRRRLREHFGIGKLRYKEKRQYDTDRDFKKDSSVFSGGEVRLLSQKLEHARYLEAVDVPTLYDDFTGGELVVNGEQYPVVEKHHVNWIWDNVKPRWQTVELYYFDGKRKRLAVLRGLDRDRCRYKHSVVLESARNYGPYERWTKDSYVRSIEVA